MARVAESLLTLRAQVDALAPGRDRSSDGTIGDESHKAKGARSDHNPNQEGVVTAMDITHDPSHDMDAGELAERLRASKDPRIKYVISNQRIFSSKISPWQWREYDGENAHTKHVHVSVVGDKAHYDDTRLWMIEPRARVVEEPHGPPSKRCIDVTATVFGGRSDFQRSAYDSHVIGDDEYGVALPFHFKGTRPKVRVTNSATGRSVVCDIVDVGPWNTHDPYWENGGRPQAESGTDRSGRRTNLAGIDLTPAAARALGLDGKGKVEWEFVGTAEAEPRPETPAAPPPDALMQRLDRLERAVAAIRVRLDDIQSQRTAETMPARPDDIAAWLDRLVDIRRKLQGAATATTPAQPTDPLRKAVDILNEVTAPGTDGKPKPLGQINGALGSTVGNLLNGKKTAIGIGGAALTSILSSVPPQTGLGQVLSALTPAIGLSPYAMPIFLAMTAWGALGKMEKWFQSQPQTGK
jgi:hypothetical protein